MISRFIGMNLLGNLDFSNWTIQQFDKQPAMIPSFLWSVVVWGHIVWTFHVSNRAKKCKGTHVSYQKSYVKWWSGDETCGVKLVVSCSVWRIYIILGPWWKLHCCQNWHFQVNCCLLSHACLKSFVCRRPGRFSCAATCPESPSYHLTDPTGLTSFREILGTIEVQKNGCNWLFKKTFFGIVMYILEVLYAFFDSGSETVLLSCPF